MKMTIYDDNLEGSPPMPIIEVDQQLILSFHQGMYELQSPCCGAEIIIGGEVLCQKCRATVSNEMAIATCFLGRHSEGTKMEKFIAFWLKELEMSNILEAEIYSRLIWLKIMEFNPHHYQLEMFSHTPEARRIYCRPFQNIDL